MNGGDEPGRGCKGDGARARDTGGGSRDPLGWDPADMAPKAADVCVLAGARPAVALSEAGERECGAWATWSVTGVSHSDGVPASLPLPESYVLLDAAVAT